MTTYNKATLKTFFENGDVPTGQNYSDLIDSQINLVETAGQAMAGPLTATKVISPLVSAATLTASTAIIQNLTISTNLAVLANVSVSGFVAIGGAVSAASINLSGDVSASTGTVYSSAMRSTNGFFSSPIIINAAGSALATATPLTAAINRVQGVVDGQTTGVKLLAGAGRTGWEQTIVNETAVSANLWPAGSDFKINALASGAAFAMAGNTTYFAVYTQTSAYAVK